MEKSSQAYVHSSYFTSCPIFQHSYKYSFYRFPHSFSWFLFTVTLTTTVLIVTSFCTTVLAKIKSKFTLEISSDHFPFSNTHKHHPFIGFLILSIDSCLQWPWLLLYYLPSQFAQQFWRKWKANFQTLPRPGGEPASQQKGKALSKQRLAYWIGDAFLLLLSEMIGAQ